MKLQITSRNVFIIFDSYPRPSYPKGFGTIASTSMEGTARRLTELFRTVDLSNSFLQFLANYKGHVFVPQGVKVSTPTLSKAVLESSLAQLSIQVEISRWQSQHESLKSEHQSLESEIKEASAPNRRQKEVAQHQQQQLASSSAAPQRHVSSSTHHSSRPSVFISTLNLFTLIRHSPAQAPVAHFHRFRPLLAMIVFHVLCARSTNLRTKTALSLHGPRSLPSPPDVQRSSDVPSPPDGCLCAAYVWKRCTMI